MNNPTLSDEVPPASQELLAQYASLRPVQSQGDGVRSMVGLLLMGLTSDRGLILIDEPEAFLHPPQARLLGRYLAQETASQAQVLLATHSADVLQGVLDAAPSKPVQVIRVSVGTDNKRVLTTLPAERISRLWTDPLLRYSGLLDGLFHKGTVICESDADCRLYAATLDVYLRQEVEHDLIFTHVGGKSRLARALGELRGFGVASAVIGDIDVLNDRVRVEQLVHAAGGDYAIIARDVALLLRDVESRVAAPTVRGLKDAVSPVLTRRNDSAISDQEAERIGQSVKRRSAWGELKRGGMRSLVGDSYSAMNRILQYLASVGVFLVPIGELERWYAEVPGHGPAHVTRVLEEGRHEDLSNELRAFLRALVQHFVMLPPTDGRAPWDRAMFTN